MSRELVALSILFVLLAGAVTAVFYSRRFARYERDRRFGIRDRKPVWKPFWHS